MHREGREFVLEVPALHARPLGFPYTELQIHFLSASTLKNFEADTC